MRLMRTHLLAALALLLLLPALAACKGRTASTPCLLYTSDAADE